MNATLVLDAAAVLILLAISAFFAGSETALTAVSRARMHQLESEGSRAAARVNRLIANRERLIGVLLLGNTFVNILASSLATSALERSFGGRAVAIVSVAMTILILVFAEVLPKTLAIARTDRFALAVSGTVKRLVAALAPVVAFVQLIVWSMLRLFGVRHEEARALVRAYDEIRGAVFLHHQEGGVERAHRDMITGVLDLGELTVADVMIHRKNMMSVDAGLPPEALIEAVLDTGHTRVPLWRGQPENIVGVLHTRDIVRAMVREERGAAAVDLAAITLPPWFVPETTTLAEQLSAFRRQRTHFALVVDEYGVLQGLVTLEDILDEIFGDIPDEHDARERPGIRPQPDGSYLVDGATPVRELNRELDWKLPDDEATTLAGLVIHEARTIPEVGQRFAFYGFKFEILRRRRNQIMAVRVTPPPKAEPPE